jgi:hypothetical protein
MKRIGSLLLGLALGVGVSLLYAWVIQPAPFANSAPSALRAEAQDEYTRWVAWAYAGDGEVARARARLAALGEGDGLERVIALAQRMAATGEDPAAVQSLGALAAALGAGPATAVAQASPTSTLTPSLTPTTTPLPTITPVPLPTRPPTPTPVGALVLTSQQLVCEPRPLAPLIQVWALDAVGQPLPGVEVLVEWNGGFDRFFTGLKPEQGAGYGDFAMLPGVTYTVRLALNPAAPLADVSAPECADAATGQTYLGAWLLTFRGQ